MTPLGWLMMIASVSSVLALLTYCLFRVFTLPAVDLDDIEGPLTIDTGDTQDAD